MIFFTDLWQDIIYIEGLSILLCLGVDQQWDCGRVFFCFQRASFLLSALTGKMESRRFDASTQDGCLATASGFL